MLYLTGDTHGDNLARLQGLEFGSDDVLVILAGFEDEASPYHAGAGLRGHKMRDRWAPSEMVFSKG